MRGAVANTSALFLHSPPPLLHPLSPSESSVHGPLRTSREGRGADRPALPQCWVHVAEEEPPCSHFLTGATGTTGTRSHPCELLSAVPSLVLEAPGKAHTRLRPSSEHRQFLLCGCDAVGTASSAAPAAPVN